ncbi:DinB family protein [Roseivirga sp. UBA1976]|uniref:DinB family protein n=1 Tax=Roseivirga sp. UBA1976 TaxID=1947386 RepID=UPI00257DED16|nr:DinB family protein [Roseivirga sp. UBA1976]MEC7753283.1 DinB family protein [Bacteroidota bacterium]|tara:strand:+ start:5610 stop:6221 length:612 start_codon:yes stop_codon:yes gene_type:complete
MKRSFLTISVVLCWVCMSVSAQHINKEERQLALKHLKSTQSDLSRLAKGLSDVQLNYKPDKSAWSIAECIKHIALTEDNIWNYFVATAWASEPKADRRDEVVMTDEQLIAAIESRANKVKTNEAFEPSQLKVAPLEALELFQKSRKSHIAAFEEANNAMRHQYASLPFGIIDGYQAVLFLSAHTRRHIEQIKEVMASPGFPAQ